MQAGLDHEIFHNGRGEMDVFKMVLSSSGYYLIDLHESWIRTTPFLSRRRGCVWTIISEYGKIP